MERVSDMTPITRRGFVKGAALAPLALNTLNFQTQTTASDRCDVVVAGAGHNSLVTTAYLAKAGFRCLVLEGRPTFGGGVKTTELTLRGFRHDVCSTAHNSIQENPMLRDREIDLAQYGLEYVVPDPVYHMPFADGSYITQWLDLDRTCSEIAKISKKDAAAYRRMFHESEKFDPTSKFWQRRSAMSTWDIIRDNFEDDRCRCFMIGCPPPTQPVNDPLTGRGAYSIFGQQRRSRPIPKGGSGALTDALAKFIEARDGVLLVNKPVTRLIVEGGKCTGVECADGSFYRADKAVLSTIHIKHLVDMAPRDLWGQDFIDGVQTWQAEVSMFATNYATTEPPIFAVQGGMLPSTNSGMMLSSERGLQIGFDHARGVANAIEAPLAVHCTTVADPTRAPTGMHTIKVISWHPYSLKEGPQHWDVIKTEVADAHLNYLRRFARNLTDDKILGRFIQSPLDLERMNPHNWHGSCHAGAQSPAQAGALRPMPGWSGYHMPIPGLYQTGACTAPGGSVSGTPGRNAAAVILKDFGTSLEEVTKKA
jgi:phytoene dehydrogenase-like protein